MVVCIDTNIVLEIFTEGHAHRPIFDAWFTGQLTWVVSTEILLEYEEVIQRLSGERKAAAVFRLMEMVSILRQNLIRAEPTFRFHLITGDPDDDKFADAAITAEADYIITQDTHFQKMKGCGYKPQPITAGDFIALVLSKILHH